MEWKFSKTFLVIILAIVFGSLSGLLGMIIIGAGNFKIPFFGKLNYIDSDLSNRIVIEQPQRVVINQDVQLAQVENDLLPAIFNIYRNKTALDPLSRAYTDSESLGHGFSLTADGWFVSTDSVIENLNSEYVLIGYQGKKYSAKKLLADKSTGLVFGKTENAGNLPVAKIGRSKDLKLGQSLVAVSARNSMSVVNISKIGYDFKTNPNLILDSDVFSKRIYVDQILDKSYDGGVLVNFKGEVVGVIYQGSALPVDEFNNVISQILDKQKIVRAALGVNYLDLAQVDGLNDIKDRGAYVIKEPIKGTAAAGFIKKGDIITKVNDEELNAFLGLAEALNHHKTGDRVDIIVIRQNQEMTIPVVLK